MNIKRPIVAGMIGLTALVPCKAQRAIELVSETGITGVVNKEAAFYTGINLQLPKEKNFSDLFIGTSVAPDVLISA